MRLELHAEDPLNANFLHKCMWRLRRRRGNRAASSDMLDRAIRDIVHEDGHTKIHALDIRHASVPKTIKEADVRDSYSVGSVQIFITKGGEYAISEPKVSPELEHIIQTVAGHLYMSMDAGSNHTLSEDDIQNHIWKACDDLGVSESISKHYATMSYYVTRNVLGYWNLDVLFKDDNIEDIMIPKYGNVSVVLRTHKQYPLYRTNIRLGSEDEFSNLVTRILEKCDAHASNAEPIVDAVTPEGDRVSVAFRQEVSVGTAMNVRKFSRTPLTIVDLFRGGMLTPTMAAYWWTLVDAMSFNIVVGVTSSGKTTMTNALLALTDPSWMIVTVEDTLEMRLPHTHVLSLRTRTSPLNKSLAYRIEDLIPITLRHNPHLVIIGEARSRDSIYATFENAAAGHGGVTTMHASSTKKTLERVRFAGVDNSYLSLLWTVWHCRELRSPRRDRVVRRVSCVDEVIIPKAGNVPIMDTIFKYDVMEDTFTEYTPSEILKKSSKLRNAGALLGLANPETDLQHRINLLKTCVESNPKSSSEVMRITGKYYRA